MSSLLILRNIVYSEKFIAKANCRDVDVGFLMDYADSLYLFIVNIELDWMIVTHIFVNFFCENNLLFVKNKEIMMKHLFMINKSKV